jgi:hypothetical protein
MGRVSAHREIGNPGERGRRRRKGKRTLLLYHQAVGQGLRKVNTRTFRPGEIVVGERSLRRHIHLVPEPWEEQQEEADPWTHQECPEYFNTPPDHSLLVLECLELIVTVVWSYPLRMPVLPLFMVGEGAGGGGGEAEALVVDELNMSMYVTLPEVAYVQLIMKSTHQVCR